MNKANEFFSNGFSVESVVLSASVDDTTDNPRTLMGLNGKVAQDVGDELIGNCNEM